MAKLKMLENQLVVKRSTIAGAGRGLFAKTFIPKGSVITEYKGKITTWEEADHADGTNLYIYYVSKNHVIDAKGNTEAFAHFANDAKGATKMKGVVNNAEYRVSGKRVFVVAIKNIAAGEEIFISYGKQYWDTLKKYKLA